MKVCHINVCYSTVTVYFTEKETKKETSLWFKKISKLDSMCLLSTGLVVGQHYSWATGWGPRGGAYDLEIWTRVLIF